MEAYSTYKEELLAELRELKETFSDLNVFNMEHEKAIEELYKAELLIEENVPDLSSFKGTRILIGSSDTKAHDAASKTLTALKEGYENQRRF
jgi:5'(3')-deoxyribonucleotidase